MAVKEKRQFLSKAFATLLALFLYLYGQDWVIYILTAVSKPAETAIVQLDWYATASPAGFKLHLGTAQTYSTLLRGFAVGHIKMTAAVLEYQHLIHHILLFQIAIASMYGLNVYLKGIYIVGFIAIRLLTMPYDVMLVLYRLHLAATAYLWGSMRNKHRLLDILSSTYKRVERVRNERMDVVNPVTTTKGKNIAVESSLAELVSSVLLFMPALLTLPTTFWYYCAAFMLYAIIHVPLEIVNGLSTFSGLLLVMPADNYYKGGLASSIKERAKEIVKQMPAAGELLYSFITGNRIGRGPFGISDFFAVFNG